MKTLVKRSAERLANQNPAEVLKALASPDTATALEMVRLAGRLRLAAAPDGMGRLLESGDREMKLAVVDALTSIASPDGAADARGGGGGSGARRADGGGCGSSAVAGIAARSSGSRRR